MHRSYFLPFVILAALCGCVSPPSSHPDDGARFVSNEQSAAVDGAELRRLRSSWAPGASESLVASQVPPLDQQWVLDFIAYTESSGPTPCRSLELVRTEGRPLAPFTVLEDYSGRPVTFRPAKYHESWFISACGVNSEWRVLDDPDDKRYQEITALLWKRG